MRVHEKEIAKIEREIAQKKREISRLQFRRSELLSKIFAEKWNNSGIEERKRLLREST